jgi:hypothetical protein
MVKESILDFERRHSKNLIELNQWLETIKAEEGNYREGKLDLDKYHTVQDKEEVEMYARMEERLQNKLNRVLVFLEDSDLTKECGILANCDPLYRKINSTIVEDMSLLKTLEGILTDEELKHRLTYENYMLLQTEKVIDDYLLRQKDKKTLEEITTLMDRIKTLEKSLNRPTMESKIQQLINKVKK